MDIGNNGRGVVEWVDIHQIVPNPLNPRRNDAIRTEEIQDIIRKRGWEEPLTVYKKGKNYIVLSGHRRLYAAKELGNIKEIPVYVVEAPQGYMEEIERIASLQSGRVDWTSYEWSMFTYERWNAWGRPPIRKFAKQINLSVSSVDRYIKVLDYFPREEIDSQLRRGTFSINILYELRQWLVHLGKVKQEFVEDMGEEIIRRTMLNKMETKKDNISISALRNTKFLQVVSEEDLRNFLLTRDSNLEDLQDAYNINAEDEYKSLHGYLVAFGQLENKVKNLTVTSEKDKESAIKGMTELKEKLEQKIKELNR